MTLTGKGGWVDLIFDNFYFEYDDDYDDDNDKTSKTKANSFGREQ